MTTVKENPEKHKERLYALVEPPTYPPTKSNDHLRLLTCVIPKRRPAEMPFIDITVQELCELKIAPYL